MNHAEHITMKGEFHLRVFRHGELVEEYTERNLIVTAGKTSMSRLIGGSGTNKQVTQIGFGTDGTSPDAGDTGLTASFVKAVDSVTYPTSTSVRFNWSLGTTEANGKAIQEFGLLSADNTLFARRTRAVINKTSDLSFEGTWTIQI